jgi:hypothetical protein
MRDEDDPTRSTRSQALGPRWKCAAATGYAVLYGATSCVRCEAPRPDGVGRPAANFSPLEAEYQSSFGTPAMELRQRVAELDKADAHIGWRAWRVGRDRDGLCLKSFLTSRATQWRPGVNIAPNCWSTACSESDVPHPSPWCACGFYAMSPLVAFQAWLYVVRQELRRARLQGLMTPSIIVGEVAVWGTVAGPSVTATGESVEDWPQVIRASHAEMLKLYSDDPGKHASLGARYAVPVFAAQDLGPPFTRHDLADAAEQAAKAVGWRPQRHGRQVKH